MSFQLSGSQKIIPKFHRFTRFLDLALWNSPRLRPWSSQRFGSSTWLSIGEADKPMALRIGIKTP
jgi:hypothetical protein